MKYCCKQLHEAETDDSIRWVRTDENHPIHWFMHGIAHTYEDMDNPQYSYEIYYCPFCGTKLPMENLK